METTEINQESISGEIEEFSKAGVLYGYSRGRRHPKMAPFLFGIRNNVEIFNILSIKEKLEEAGKFMKELGINKKSILLIGTKPAAREIIKKAAQSISMPYVTGRWLGGTLTNFKIIRGRIDHLIDLRVKKTSGELEKYTKKERLEIDKELERLERDFNGLELLTALPNALLVVDAKEEATAVREAKKIGIPIVAILNSDSDPSDIAYPIPANDTSVSSINYLVNKLVEAYKV